MIHIAIVGSRTYPHEGLVRALVRGLPRDWTIVSGGAKGPDTWAVDEAKALGMGCSVYPADWTQGKGAGMARNTTIVENSDIVVAFMEEATSGTTDTIQKAYWNGKLVYALATEADVNRCLSHLA